MCLPIMTIREEFDDVNKLFIQKINSLKILLATLENDKNQTDINSSDDIVIKLEEDDPKTNLSRCLFQLEEKLHVLKSLYNFDSALESTDDINVTINIINSDKFTTFLNNILSQFIEYAIDFIAIYKTEETADNSKHLKKCISKIRKKIKALNLMYDPDDLNNSTLTQEDNSFNRVVKNLYKFKKKVSKLISAYKKKYNISAEIIETPIEIVSHDEEQYTDIAIKNSPKKRKHKDSESSSTRSPKKEKKIKNEQVLEENINEDIIYNISDATNDEDAPKKFKSKKKRSASRSNDSVENISGSDMNNFLEISILDNDDNINIKSASPRKISEKSEMSDTPNNCLDSMLDNLVQKVKEKKCKETIKKSPSKRKHQDSESSSTRLPKKEKKIKTEQLPGENGSQDIIYNISDANNDEDAPKKTKSKKKHSESQSNDSAENISASDMNNFLELSILEKDKTNIKSPSPSKISAKSEMSDTPNTCLDSMLDNLVQEVKEKKSKEAIKKERRHSLNSSKNEHISASFNTTCLDNDEIEEENLIQELANDNYNILDKSVFNIHMLLEEAENRTMLSEHDKEKLKELFIVIPTEVPPVHLIETRLTIGPTAPQKILLKEYNVKLGQFTAEEDAILDHNWKNFCKEYDFHEAHPFLTWQHEAKPILSHTERVKFVQYLGQQLGHRMLSSIYRRFKLIYGDTRKGRFTKEEDEIILSHAKTVKKGGARFSPLIHVLNRSRVAIQARYFILTSGERKIVRWNLDLDREFLKHLMEELNTDDVFKLRNMHIKTPTWKAVSAKMDIPYHKLKLHWNFKLYTQLFAEDRICWDELKIRLIETLEELKVEDWKAVDWNEIACHFNGFTPQFLWFLAKTSIRHNVPQQFRTNLRKSVKYMYKHTIPILQMRIDKDERRAAKNNSFIKKQLHRLKFDEDGVLQSYYY